MKPCFAEGYPNDLCCQNSHADDNDPRIMTALPDLRLGDSWTYRIQDRLRQSSFRETRRIVALDDATLVCEQRSDAPGYASGRWIYTRSWNLVSRPALAAPGDTEEDAGRWVWQPHFPLFRFPLKAGARWSGTAEVRNEVADTTNRHHYETTVLGAVDLPVEFPPALRPRRARRPIRVRYLARVEVVGSDPPQSWQNEETYDYLAAVNAVMRMQHRVRDPAGTITREAESLLIDYQRGPA